MMCTSELFDPSSESDFKERSIQVKSNNFKIVQMSRPGNFYSRYCLHIVWVYGYVFRDIKKNIFDNFSDLTMFQHHVTFRNLSEGKGTVRLNSGKLNLFTHLKISWVENCRIIFSQENMRRVDLKCFTRKHEPLEYQV